MALVTGTALFVGVLTAALSKLLASEIDAWTPNIACRLVKLAVRCLPKSLRERFAEEWQAHVDEVPGNLGKLVTTLGFFLAVPSMLMTEEHNHAVERLQLYSLHASMLSKSRRIGEMMQERIDRGDQLIIPIRNEVDALRNKADKVDYERLSRSIGALCSLTSHPVASLAIIGVDRALRRKFGLPGSAECLQTICETQDRIIRYLEYRRRLAPEDGKSLAT